VPVAVTSSSSSSSSLFDLVFELLVDVDFGWSLLCQLIWIIGAYMLKAVIFASSSGTVWKPKSPLLLPSHVTVGIVVEVATMMHVWPLMLPQPKPLSAS
jgi:hypothetical protein